MMAALSDHLLIATIVGYALAMLAYAAQYAFGQRGVVARVATRELVAPGAPAVPAPVSPAPAAATLRTEALAARTAIVAMLLAWALHLAAIVTRGLAAHRVPWGNMYEFVLVACFVCATAWLGLVARRPSVRPLGLYSTLALTLLLGLDMVRLYTPVEPLMPALDSYWLKIHVTAAVTASGVLMAGFVLAAMTLVRIGYDQGKRGFPYPLGERLPGADSLERLTFRVHTFAFPIWTFAIICGAIWAEAAWGRYWGWDPKETWSFIAWVIYAGYLHARATPSVKRRWATWIAIAGWCAMMVNLFVVNLVVSGLHSYAQVGK